MASSLRRLIKDHAKLRNDPPPNYLFPEADDSSSIPDDLTQLLILVTGAEGTPYSQGLWRLHLKIPEDYPKSPPKATFKTRIYHPNVEESTGAVCLETLKRDWDPKLTLKDILITISCLLIQPNPDSALNAAAGALIQENYDQFSKQARLMTRIHAPIPTHLTGAVKDAKRRGEDDLSIEEESSETLTNPTLAEGKDDSKENQPDQVSTTSSWIHPKGKRHISGLSSTPISDVDNALKVTETLQPSLSNDSRNSTNAGPSIEPGPRKSPKHSQSSTATDGRSYSPTLDVEDEKENLIIVKTKSASQFVMPRPTALRKVSNVGTRRSQPRVGIRRL